MPIILSEEETGKLGGRRIIVPKEVSDAIQKQLNTYGKSIKSTKGYKRAKSLTSDDYNNRSNNRNTTTKNGERIISFSDLKKIDHEMRHMNQNPNNLQYTIQGGDKTRNWAASELDRLRGSVKKVEKVKPVPKIDKGKVNPANVGSPNTEITITNLG